MKDRRGLSSYLFLNGQGRHKVTYSRATYEIEVELMENNQSNYFVIFNHEKKIQYSTIQKFNAYSKIFIKKLNEFKKKRTSKNNHLADYTAIGFGALAFVCSK